jgi:hypothetical protein
MICKKEEKREGQAGKRWIKVFQFWAVTRGSDWVWIVGPFQLSPTESHSYLLLSLSLAAFCLGHSHTFTFPQVL